MDASQQPPALRAEMLRACAGGFPPFASGDPPVIDRNAAYFHEHHASHDTPDTERDRQAIRQILESVGIEPLSRRTPLPRHSCARLDAIQSSDISYSIDAGLRGYHVRLGTLDPEGAPYAEVHLEHFGEVLDWLQRVAPALYPDSDYALEAGL